VVFTPRGDQKTSVRDVLIHMIEEYARHCGHADLLRECIDGRTGQ
jgi:ribosomal protein S3AE